MLYTTLGRTNRKVSRIGFGGCPAGVKNYVETYDPGKTDDQMCIRDSYPAELPAHLIQFTGGWRSA